jgi:protein TonB
MEIDSSEAESALAGIDDPSIPGQGVGSGIGGGASWRSPPPAVAVEPAPAPPRVVVLKEARLVERVAPVYPNVAVAAGISGQVILEALVDPNGRVAAVDVILGHRLFEQAARDAVLRWRYEPLLLNGVPTPFRLTVTVHFRLR